MPRETNPSFARHELNIRIGQAGLLDAAGAITFLAAMPIGYVAYLEAVRYVPEVAGAGAGAAQTLEIRKGGAAGTILSTVALTLANHVLAGAGIAGSAISDSASRFADTDTISITKAAGGTVFSTSGGTLTLRFRQKLQARN
jgi:hypothetical protein